MLTSLNVMKQALETLTELKLDPGIQKARRLFGLRKTWNSPYTTLESRKFSRCLLFRGSPLCSGMRPQVSILHLSIALTRDSFEGEFEGYCIDMIKEIEKLLNFTSEFHEFYEFGKFNEKDGTWSGVIRELLDKRLQKAFL